jgi:iron complex transport system substrate-binding protein
LNRLRPSYCLLSWWPAPGCALAALCAALTALSGEGAPLLRVTDDAGSTVMLQRPATRIVSLAPSITEQLFAIGVGARVVGTSASSDYPEAARSIAIVGGVGGVDLERIAALHPDLVVAWGSGYPPQTQEALKRLGATVYVSEPTSLESIASTLERLGILTGAEQASAQAQSVRAAVRALRARYAARRPVRAFYQIWPQPLMTLSGRHIVSEALALCGARNVFEHLKALAPTVSPEAVIAADPQIILTDAPAAIDRGELDFWKHYPFISAVANGQLVTLDADRMARPTPRMLPEVARMCERIDAARVASER